MNERAGLACALLTGTMLLAAPAGAQLASCGPFFAAWSIDESGEARTMLSDRAVGAVVFARHRTQVFGFAIVARGKPGSGGSGGGASSSVGGETGQFHGIVRLAHRLPQAEYDIGPDSAVVRIAGVRTDVRGANVVLVDQPDSGGPPTISVSGCLDPYPQREALTRLEGMASVKAFVGDGNGKPRSLYGQAWLITGGALILLLAVVADVIIVARRWRAPPMGQPSPTGFSVTYMLAVALAFGPVLPLLVIPSYSDGQTLIRVNGLYAVLPVLLPTALALLPMMARGALTRAIACAGTGILMTAFSIIAGFSIGLFFFPAAMVMLAAALVGLVGTLSSRLVLRRGTL